MGSGGNNYEKEIPATYALPETEPDADPGETTNLFFKKVEKRKEMQVLLRHLNSSSRSALKDRQPLGLVRVKETWKKEH